MSISLTRYSSGHCDANEMAELVGYGNFMMQELGFGGCELNLFVKNKHNLLQTVNRIRRENGLPEAGEIKQAILDFEALMVLTKGVRHSRVIKLKAALHNMGYIEKPFTDIYDENAELAVKAYQKNNNLKVTGIVDITLIRHLYWHAGSFINQINLGDVATITAGKFLGKSEDQLMRPKRILHGKIIAAIQEGDLAVTNGEWMGVDKVDYLKQLLAKGCSGVITDAVVDKSLQHFLPIIRVKSTVNALVRLAGQARSNLSGNVIAVTGSAGKTSAKEMLAFVLSKQANTIATHGSANSTRAICYKLLNAPLNSEFYIFESGLGATGSSILHHSNLLAPVIALVTSVHLAHAAGYHNVEEIARRKADIFTALHQDGYAVIDRDSECYFILREEALQKGVKNIFSFGWHSGADAKLISIDVGESGTLVNALLNGKVIRFKLPMIGQHWGKLGLAVLSCCLLAGADIPEAIKKLKYFPVVSGRGNLINLAVQQGNITVFDSHYNANPGSMQADLGAFGELMQYKTNRKIGILGEMNELGGFSETCHRSLAEWVVNLNFTHLVLIGEEMRYLYDELAGQTPVICFNSVTESFSVIKTIIQDGDYVFLKGSRGNELERIFPQLSV
ncbi:MAG: Mur ligase family protein [Methylococcales bacterium]